MALTAVRAVRLAAALSAAVLLAGCSAGHSVQATPPTASPKGPATTPGDSQAAASAAAAKAALNAALAQTRRWRSYSFDTTQTLTGGSRTQQTTIRGTAVRPSAVSYDLTIGGRTEQVIRLGARSYLRVPPGAWKSVARPGPTVDPVSSLLSVLTYLTPQTVTAPTGPGTRGTAARTLTGTVAGSALVGAGLAPTGAQAPSTTPVTVTLDAAGYVTGLSVAVEVEAGGVAIRLIETSRYGTFNRIQPIRAPGKVRTR